MSQNYQHGYLRRQNENRDRIVGNFSGEKTIRQANEFIEPQSLERSSSVRQKNWLCWQQMASECRSM